MDFPKYRLFDVLSYQLEKFPKKNMLNAKENGEWKGYGTAEVQTIVNRFSAGLLKLGINGNNFTPEGSHKIAIISNNRPEWIFTDMAVQQTGAILVENDRLKAFRRFVIVRDSPAIRRPYRMFPAELLSRSGSISGTSWS